MKLKDKRISENLEKILDSFIDVGIIWGLYEDDYILSLYKSGKFRYVVDMWNENIDYINIVLSPRSLIIRNLYFNKFVRIMFRLRGIRYKLYGQSCLDRDFPQISSIHSY